MDLSHILMLVGLVVFLVASFIDSNSSLGMRERIPFLRNKEGYFDPKRYIIYTAGVSAALMLIGWNWGSVQAVIVLFASAAFRFWAGLYYNPKQRGGK